MPRTNGSCGRSRHIEDQTGNLALSAGVWSATERTRQCQRCRQRTAEKMRPIIAHDRHQHAGRRQMHLHQQNGSAHEGRDCPDCGCAEHCDASPQMDKIRATETDCGFRDVSASRSFRRPFGSIALTMPPSSYSVCTEMRSRYCCSARTSFPFSVGVHERVIVRL